ncbi:TPA: hypothetical protein VGS73_003764 [Vibrio cholerae]|uniref:hypothetical protein n=1 Tax=Vibrio cholerae TaxID=666 RepID=UPI001F2B9EFD|nr:hypothetical protein [Vibrio cholerae]UIP02799.1 hypothetical protein LY388_05090 [Vibrio cholerae]HEQ3435007.1 hypothetical protein [Vibrio cholerae]HEQ3495888.1 hypothetical protein [Vibrio cholerae]HEQ3507647.1 hypothetical protein [Vibrio cholerae]HEQ3572177.1 hypothetical protein [Vibrio cholerae]
MVTVVVFEFSGMRCQPLRRALAFELYQAEYYEKYLSCNEWKCKEKYKVKVEVDLDFIRHAPYGNVFWVFWFAFGIVVLF